MQIKPEALSRQLAQNGLLPAYLVSGDEPFQQQECTDLLRRTARDKGFDERHLFSADSGIDWPALYAEAQSLSLFGGARILEVRLGEKRPDKSASEMLVQLLEAPPPDTLLVISCSKLDRRRDHGSRWVKALDQVGAMIEVWPVAAGQLPGWIEARLRRLGLAASGDALALLVERSEGNLLAAAQEVDKLALLFPGATLTPEQVEAAVGHSSRFSPFDLGDALGGGDLPRALRILDTLHAEGVESPVVLWALTREVRQLAQIIGGEDPGRLPPQRLRQLQQQARRLGPAGVQQAVALAARADQALKGMADGDPWQHLTSLVLRLGGQPLPAVLEL
ncbi:DNA polymerase III subunit delta [Isoalcanivorax beigongshangi]|uniref:DNA polymerase III subunit delta n=1 Tax=Isoalcanivorax beigongshangi TaxID=3238810 RepID=A0ABV4AEP5_9GAMM